MEHSSLARQLILDEILDVTLYRRMARGARGDTKAMLSELIRTEERHAAFWKDFFHADLSELDRTRRIKLSILAGIARISGERGIHLILEAVEVYGIKKYLDVWERYKGTPLGDALRSILTDEFSHEEEAVKRLRERRINPERVRNLFLGFNDGLVEIVGAVSGFFAAFGDPAAVLIAGLTTAVAGSISMAAGIFGAVSSEKEIRRLEDGRRAFLENKEAGAYAGEGALRSAALVGVSYFFGSLVPIAPVLLGAQGIALPFAAACVFIILVSFVVAFLSGMEVKKRLLINLGVVVLAITITYSIGRLAQSLLGIAVM